MLDKAQEVAKAKALKNYWKIDSYRSTDDDTVIDTVVDHLILEGLSLPKQDKYAQSLKDQFKIILLNLFYTYANNRYRYVQFYRDGSKYKDIPNLSIRNVTKITDFLKEKGYIELEPGYPKSEQYKAQISKMRATPKLISVLRDHEVEPEMVKRDTSDFELVIMKGKKIKGVRSVLKTPKKPIVKEIRENLRIINDVLSRTHITLYMTKGEFRELNRRIIRKEDPYRQAIDFSRKNLYRVFVDGDLNKGGRFYGGWWQGIPKDARHLIRLNRKDIVEADYSAIHPSILYAKEGLEIPEGDLYKIEGYPTKQEDPVFRKFVKSMLLMMVNADSRSDVRGALHKAVHRDRKLILPRCIPSTNSGDLYPLMDSFGRRHEKIRHYFFTDIGKKLQYWDSQIAERVMLQFAKMNRAVLPIHDSFIIHHGLEEELEDAMNKAFFDECGVKAKIEIEYSSIEKRAKEESEVCETSLEDLLEDERKYDTFKGEW